MKCELAVAVAMAVPTPAQAGDVRRGSPPVAASLRGLRTTALVETPGPKLAPPLPPTAVPSAEPRSGVGLMIAGGVVMAFVAAPAIGVGAAAPSSGQCWSVGGSCDENGERPGSGLITLGVLAALAGAGLLVGGGVRYSQWRRWKANQQTFSPRLGRTALGTGTLGLTLRF
ncbi:hypothetical protein [Nannocystis sp.]|uniref:hypothetical protein n=1 Tax=Nannocystis sp. TaxID=1962667 RepID=UPI0025E50123|nr:hypothetical protein [Nannocystis sp.]